MDRGARKVDPGTSPENPPLQAKMRCEDETAPLRLPTFSAAHFWMLQCSKFCVTKVTSSMTKAACASMLNEHPQTAILGGALGCCMEAKALGFEERACVKAARAIMRLGLGLRVTMTGFSSGGAAFRRKARGEDEKL